MNSKSSPARGDRVRSAPCLQRVLLLRAVFRLGLAVEFPRLGPGQIHDGTVSLLSLYFLSSSCFFLFIVCRLVAVGGAGSPTSQLLCGSRGARGPTMPAVLAQRYRAASARGGNGLAPDFHDRPSQVVSYCPSYGTVILSTAVVSTTPAAWSCGQWTRRPLSTARAHHASAGCRTPESQAPRPAGASSNDPPLGEFLLAVTCHASASSRCAGIRPGTQRWVMGGRAARGPERNRTVKTTRHF